MARRTKDDAEKTRNAILNAAERVFFKHGVSRTSLQEVARAAGVTRGAVYWHFKDKIELCEAMTRRVFLPQEDLLERLAESHSDTPLDELQKACTHSLNLLATDKRRQRVISILMFRCEYVEDMRTIMERRAQCKDRMLKASLHLFEQAAELNMMAASWSPSIAAVSMQALMGGLIAGVLEGRKNYNFTTVGTACIEAFFKGLRAK